MRLSSFFKNRSDNRINRLMNVRTVKLFRSTCDVHIENGSIDRFWVLHSELSNSFSFSTARSGNSIGLPI